MTDFFAYNLSFIQSVSSNIFNAVNSVADRVNVQQDNSSNLRIYFGDKLISDSILVLCQSAFLGQASAPSRVLMQKMVFEAPLVVDSSELFNQILGADDVKGLQHLKSLHFDPSLPNLSDQRVFNGSIIPPDLVLLGSFSLLYVQSLVEQFSINSIVLIESDPSQLAAVLHLLDFQDLVSQLKVKNIRFNVIYDDAINTSEAQISQISNHFARNNPISMHALGIFRSPIMTPALNEIFSWFHDTAGFLESVKGLLGNETDEVNQVTHSLYTALHYGSELKSIDVPHAPHEYPAVVVASGPSLDETISCLRKDQQQLLIFASASALGALLRSGIKPKAVVLLEMSSIVYRDLLDLVSEGFIFDGITAFVSATVDPRIPSLFPKTIVFQRPLSSAVCLFLSEQDSALPQAGPQAVNASLEVCIHLGYRKLLLVGCDFGAKDPNLPRASGSMGLSPRIFDYPVAGAQGKTVFSNAQLCSTRYLFENIIDIFNVNAVCIGDGALVRGVTHLPMSEEYDISEFHCCSAGTKCFDQLGMNRVVKKEDFFDVIEQASIENHKVHKELLNFLNEDFGSTWSSRFSLIFNQHISSDEKNLSHGQQLHRRMTRSLYFFAVQPLREVSPDNFPLVKSNLVESLIFIHDFYDNYYQFLRVLLEKTVMPIWDESWVKSLYTC